MSARCSQVLVTHDHGSPTGWFADMSDEEYRLPEFPWQPFIQTAGGCFPLPIWFETEDACIEFIRKDILGRGLLD
ncbi:MAG TPA: hypothetical protein VJX66_31960 [Amycolatopsis sp.]|nr:hypothetical protein [Amycolatopsis sp.]